MQLEPAQNTAYQNYNKILKALKDTGAELKNCNYGLCFADVSALDSDTLKEIFGENFDAKKCSEFLELLRAIHKFLGGFITDSVGNERQELSEMKNKFLYISSPKEMTRTTLITAYYYLYNRLHENAEIKNFVEFFKSFKLGIDTILDSSG